MRINVGFEMVFDCPQPTPMIFNLNVHFTRVSDLIGRDDLVFDPPVPVDAYRDGFGNWCTRIVAPAGRSRVTANAILNDTGLADRIVPDAQQVPVSELPVDTLVYLLGSRYCETDRLSETAWNLFQHVSGWDRVQAICDFVHNHVTFGYEHARVLAAVTAGAVDEAEIVARSARQTLMLLGRRADVGRLLFDSGLPADRFGDGVRAHLQGDLQRGIASGCFAVADVDVVCTVYAGVMLGACLDIYRGRLAVDSAPAVTEYLLSALGVGKQTAQRLVETPQPFTPWRPLPLSEIEEP